MPIFAPTYSPVWDQYVLSDGWLVGGILPFPAPAQNHPLVLMGWRWSASQPLPLKLHFRPEVHTTDTLSALTTEAISLYYPRSGHLPNSFLLAFKNQGTSAILQPNYHNVWRIVFPQQGVIELPSRQIKYFLQKGNRKN